MGVEFMGKIMFTTGTGFYEYNVLGSYLRITHNGLTFNKSMFPFGGAGSFPEREEYKVAFKF